MAPSLFFEFPETSREAFARAGTLGEWYDAVQSAGAEDARTFDGQESAAPWQYALAQSQVQSAVGRLFIGDLRSSLEVSSEPVVVFHDRASVGAVAEDLRQRGESFFRSALARHGHAADVWMYRPLLTFFEEAAKRQNAVVLLWSA